MSSKEITVANKIGLQDIASRPLVFKTESPFDRQKKLLFSEYLSDVLFKVGSTGELIHAHKLIISIASDVFYAQFNGGFDESQRDNTEKPIVIEDIEPATFKEVLRYIYCEQVDLTADNAIDILYASEKYMLTGLREKCDLFLNSSVNENNVLLVFNKNQQYKFDFVDEICLNMIRDNPLMCFQSKYFRTLSQPALELITASSAMNCQKEQLCEAIEDWRDFNDSTAVILPKWEYMSCRKLHSYSGYYGTDVSTDFTINVKQKLHIHGLGVFVGKEPGVSTQTTALVTVTIDHPFNVSVSKEICFKKEPYVQEIVFKRLTVTNECRIKVTVEATGEAPQTTPLFCLHKFTPVDTDETKGLTIKHNNTAKVLWNKTGTQKVNIDTNCVAYLLFESD